MMVLLAGSISNDELGVFFLGILVIFVIFLIFRELVCWYWKINKGIQLLESIDSKLSTLGRIYQSGTTDSPAILDENKEICPFCKEESNKADVVCDVCGKRKR